MSQIAEVFDTGSIRNLFATQVQLGAHDEIYRRDDTAGILAHHVGAEVRVREGGLIDEQVGTRCH